MADKLDLMLTVKREQLLEAVRGGRKLDISELVADVPSVEIKGGDRFVSVRLWLDHGDLNKLKSAVSAFCLIDPYGELELFGHAAKRGRKRKRWQAVRSPERTKSPRKSG